MPEPMNITLAARTQRILRVAGILAGLAVSAGVIFEPARTWPNVLLAGYFLVGVGAAAALLLAFLSVTNAGWGVAIRRVPEALSANLLPGGLWMIAVLFGIHSLYEWSHADAVAADHILQEKTWWLNVPAFAMRTVLYPLLWGGLAFLLVRSSRRQDRDGDLSWARLHRRYAGLYIVVFALTFWIASMDWLMSIEPHWYSTIFGVYNFSGTFLAGLAVVTITVISLRRAGYLREFVRDEHLHDLGKLIFAFSTFWMYIWFSQYMLIWYANIPEETGYFIRRQTGGWGTLMLLNLLFNWVIPFTVLMSKKAKRHEGLLFKVCIAVLVGHWIDLYWMILPPFMPEAPEIHLWVIAPVVLAFTVLYGVTARALGAASLVPSKDPLLMESMQYHA